MKLKVIYNLFKRVITLPKNIISFLLTMLIIFTTGCKKFVKVDSLKDQILSQQVFNNDATANSAIAGIYAAMTSASSLPIELNLFGSCSGDDITFLLPIARFTDFQNNTVQPTNGLLAWGSLYTVISQANLAIEGLESNTGIPETKRLEYLGEAQFLRAYCYFYLVNYFGDVPLIVSSDVAKAAIAKRSPASDVYAQIVADLKAAQTNLPSDYSLSNGDRTRANKWAAAALLARTYLYLKQWNNAELQSTAIINSGSYSLLTSPVGICALDNKEAILQWARYSGQPFALVTSYFIQPVSPRVALTNTLLNAFENGDERKTTWTYQLISGGQTYYCPFKLTDNNTNDVSVVETPLRLGEQYLIRAEALAEQNKISEAVADLNMIRLNHGSLANQLSPSLTQSACLTAVMHERQVELFAEESHRWFDLKRTGEVNAVMQAEKPGTWKSTAALYPIPLSDIQTDPNLVQNPGY